ncbi:MAG TPA: hypothetical protein VG675_07060 [Bryobacteraceae bacterium]|nr:hypothetical protein [Bryobacteraceae bacterium]
MFRRHHEFLAKARIAKQRFENKPDFPSVQVELMDATQKLRNDPASQAEKAVRLLDLLAAGYLSLVDTLEDQKAYSVLLEWFRRTAIQTATGFSFAQVQFSGSSDLERTLAARVIHWTRESYQRLIPTAQSPDRRGYRTEVKAWMDREKLGTISEAARALGISESTLKSIMSDRGEPRYGAETLNSVLAKIRASE